VKAQAAHFAFDETGNLYFLGANPVTIFKFAPDGTVSKFATGNAESDWSEIAIDRAGNVLVLATTEHPRGRVVDVVVTIFKFTSAGKRSTWIPDAGKGQPTGFKILFLQGGSYQSRGHRQTAEQRKDKQASSCVHLVFSRRCLTFFEIAATRRSPVTGSFEENCIALV